VVCRDPHTRLFGHGRQFAVDLNQAFPQALALVLLRQLVDIEVPAFPMFCKQLPHIGHCVVPCAGIPKGLLRNPRWSQRHESDPLIRVF